MEGSKNTLALILNRQPYREYDSLVTIYTPDYGKLILVARGLKKLQSKLAGHLEPLTLADIMIISGKGRDYVGAALGREIYSGLRGDLNKLYYAGQAVKIFSQLVRDSQADPRLFFLLTDWLAVLNNFSVSSISTISEPPSLPDFSREDGELLLAFFIIKFLTELGYQPEMYKCVGCGQPVKPGKNYFSLMKGGIVCDVCLDNERQNDQLVSNSLLTISDDCVKIIRFIMNNKLDQAEKLRINKKLIRELASLVNNFLLFNF